MDVLSYALSFILHLDVHLNHLMAVFGPWIYLILFLVIFCETGLVVTPFLPGDSLLFTLGALCAVEGSVLKVVPLSLVLIVAAVLGDAVNYAVGRFVGPKVFNREENFWLNKKHLFRAQAFYEKHGGKTIILARFAPIFRTFAPFVAGIGKMSYPRFALFNVVGGISWILIFVCGGYFFGNLPSVKEQFHWVILAIIVISVIPVVIEWFRARRTPDGHGVN